MGGAASKTTHETEIENEVGDRNTKTCSGNDISRKEVPSRGRRIARMKGPPMGETDTVSKFDKPRQMLMGTTMGGRSAKYGDRRSLPRYS